MYGFGGTSASCPMVAGAIALTLEAKLGNACISGQIFTYSLYYYVTVCSPDLTWRDVMYLIVFTSNPSLTSGGSYTTNRAGIRFSPKFGFGVLDAEAMVARARHWVNVPPQLEHRRVPSSSSGSAASNSASYNNMHLSIEKSIPHSVVPLSIFCMLCLVSLSEV